MVVPPSATQVVAHLPAAKAVRIGQLQRLQLEVHDMAFDLRNSHSFWGRVSESAISLRLSENGRPLRNVPPCCLSYLAANEGLD